MRAASLCSPPLSCIWLWRAIIVIIILMGPYAATPPTLRMLGTGHLPVFSFLASSDRTSCTPAKCKPTFDPLPSNQNLERMSCGVYGFDASTKSLLCAQQACSKASMEACRFLSRSLTALLPVCLCRRVHPWPSHPQPNFATTPHPNLDPNPKDPVVLERGGSGCNPTCDRQVGLRFLQKKRPPLPLAYFFAPAGAVYMQASSRKVGITCRWPSLVPSPSPSRDLFLLSLSIADVQNAAAKLETPMREDQSSTSVLEPLGLLTFPLSLLSLLRHEFVVSSSVPGRSRYSALRGKQPKPTHLESAPANQNGAPATTVLTFLWRPKLHISSPEPAGIAGVTKAPPLRSEVAPPGIQHLSRCIKTVKAEREENDMSQQQRTPGSVGCGPAPASSAASFFRLSTSLGKGQQKKDPRSLSWSPAWHATPPLP